MQYDAPTQIIKGGCLCGQIRYRISATPTGSCICHCESCRRAAGASTVAWVTAPKPAFLMTQGNLTQFHSSPPVTRGFCARCGTTLTYEYEGADSIDITTATLDDPDAWPPTREIWLQDKLSWQVTDPGLEHFTRTRHGPGDDDS